MNKILKKILIALRKQKMIEEEFARNHTEEYKQYCKLLEDYFATEENIFKKHLTKHNKEEQK